jgi:predicted NodU family carbamoyl transferase
LDGRLVAAVAENRFGPRRKQWPVSRRTVAEVLRMVGAAIREVDYAAIGNDSNANLGTKAAHISLVACGLNKCIENQEFFRQMQPVVRAR